LLKNVLQLRQNLILSNSMNAFLLARVSTEEQKEAGNSLPSQLTRLTKYCNEHNLTIIKQYNFDESAWKSDRLEFKKIVDSLKNSKEITALCCDKIDRLIRNFTTDLVILEELRRNGKIELHFPSDNIILHKDSPATDLFRFTIGVSLAKYYSDSISDNVKRAYENKIRQGEWIGKAPLGYIYSRNQNGKRDIVIDPERGQFIRKIFELYATGNYSLRKIQVIMKESGLKSNTKIPKPLATGNIYGIINNPFYYGMMKIKNELFPHNYEPLISKELFNEVKEVQSSWQRKPFQHVAKPYIFRGLIKCAECGCTITPETQKGHIYYSCTNSRKKHLKRVYVPEKELLEPIYGLMEGLKLSDDNIQELVDNMKYIDEVEDNYYKSTIQNLRKEYENIDKRIDSLTDLYSNKKINEELYLRKIKLYSENQNDILEQIENHEDADTNYYLTANMMLNLAKKAREIFDGSEVSKKRELLNFLLQNCELKGKKLQYKLKSPFDTILLAGGCSEMLPITNTFRTLDWKNIANQLKILNSETNIF